MNLLPVSDWVETRLPMVSCPLHSQANHAFACCGALLAINTPCPSATWSAQGHQQTKTDDKIRGRRRSALTSRPAVIGNGWSFGSPPAKKSPGTNPRLDVSDYRPSRPAADGVS